MQKLWGFVNTLGMIVVAIGFIAKSAVIVGLGLALAVFGQWQKGRAEKEHHAQSQSASIRPALQSVFDSVDYRPDEQLTCQDIDPMQLLLHTSYHYVTGSDKALAKHRGISVLLGNVRLMETETFREEDTNFERTDEKEVWQGLMLTCKTGHAFPIGFAVTPRGKIDGLLRYADVKTGNERFDRRFTVKTDNGDAALLTLAPRMQERILAAADASCGAFYVTFCQDGRVSMAVNAGRNFFLPAKASADARAEQTRISENLRRMLDIIDETNPIAQEGVAQ